MSTFNTLLFIQTEGQPAQEPAAFTQNETPAPTYTAQPASDFADPPPPAQQDKGFGSGWIFILLIIAVFYFLMIRPQSKRAKEERKFRESLKKGDKIVTTAGIHGKIVEIEETTVVIETEGQGKLKIEKIAIGRHQPS